MGRKPSLEHLCACISAGYVHNPTHKYGKLGLRVAKIRFIRYSDPFKGYAVFGEHPNGGMTEINSHNVEFCEDEFQVLMKLKRT